VRRLNRPPRREAGADALAPAREAREVVEADRAREDYVRMFEERAVEFDGRAALRLSQGDVLGFVRGVVIEGADALRDERRQEFRTLLASDSAVNAGREDDAQVVRRDAERAKTRDEKVEDMRAHPPAPP